MIEITTPNIVRITVGTVAGLSLLGMVALEKWGIFWYDEVAHVLGGVMLAPPLTVVVDPLVAYLATFIIAVVWEGFEFAEGVTPWAPAWSLNKAIDDTTSDLGFVMLGAFGSIEILIIVL